MSLAAILKVASMMTRLVAVGAKALDVATAGRDALSIMVDERRDPTDAELVAIESRITARGDRIDDVDLSG